MTPTLELLDIPAEADGYEARLVKSQDHQELNLKHGRCIQGDLPPSYGHQKYEKETTLYIYTHVYIRTYIYIYIILYYIILYYIILYYIILYYIILYYIILYYIILYYIIISYIEMNHSMDWSSNLGFPQNYGHIVVEVRFKPRWKGQR